MWATTGLLDDVVSFQVPSRPAPGDGASRAVTSEHLLAEPRCHRGRRALGRGRIERAEQLGVARRALEHLRADVDLAPGAILGDVPAVRTLLVGDLVRRPLLVATDAIADPFPAELDQLAAMYFERSRRRSRGMMAATRRSLPLPTGGATKPARTAQ